MNIVPESAPFTREQRAWLNGFLAGLLFDRLPGTSTTQPQALPGTGAATPAPQPNRALLVAFGSQSGTAATLARRIAREAEAHGFKPRVAELNSLNPADLPSLGPSILLTSTWGDGEFPDNATTFWSALSDPQAPALTGLEFAVLGLGDRNYTDFCGAARKLDDRIAALGGRRIAPRADCDTDYEAAANAWIAALWPALAQASQTPTATAPQTQPAAGPPPAPAEARTTVQAAPRWNRQNPFPARLRTARPLNGPGSAKDTRHVEILLGDSGLSYEAGDALGVLPRNCPALVEELLSLLGLSGDEPCTAGTAATLHDALMGAWVITQAPATFARAAASRAPTSTLGNLVASEPQSLDSWLAGRDLVDVLRAAPDARFQPGELAELLRPLQPRLYSISSSPKAHPAEVHLTVGTVRYETHGRPRRGVASCWLADRVVPGSTPVPVFVHVSRNFRPPTDPARPMIMVGPGTGIAPFRAFLQDRRATGATGRNWLFFGDQHRHCDFLYADEFEPMASDGFLTRLDLAFSRDQEAKVYVQDRMRAAATELWRWLEDGAHFYVCGDARRMARDVDAALLDVVRTAGGLQPEAAAAYVDSLRSTGRYQRDVY